MRRLICCDSLLTKQKEKMRIVVVPSRCQRIHQDSKTRLIPIARNSFPLDMMSQHPPAVHHNSRLLGDKDHQRGMYIGSIGSKQWRSERSCGVVAVVSSEFRIVFVDTQLLTFLFTFYLSQSQTHYTGVRSSKPLKV
jgi:hypothetical protein